MGNVLNCCKGNNNIDNYTEHNDEIYYNPNLDDYLILDDDIYSSNKDEDYSKIDQELPLDFQYNSYLDNGTQIFLSTNIYDDNQQEFLINEINYLEEQTIYDMKTLQKEQLNKLKQLLEYCNKNGKTRSSKDFDPEGWKKFYPKNDPYFIIQDMEITHNQLKIYNKTDINNIKIYQGDLNILGQRHGMGKYTTPYFVLIGMWKDDKFCGWGRESRCNGDVFEGRFENGLINGKGIFLNSKKNKYIGDFKNMRRWGKGKLATDKIIYEGDFYNNQIHGNGRIKFLHKGIEYIGSFKNSIIDGYGTFKWKNGDKYDGEVKNGKMHGVGRFTYNNGEFYQGIFNNGHKAERKAIKNILENKEAQINNNSNYDSMDNENDIRYLSTYRNYGFGDA